MATDTRRNMIDSAAVLLARHGSRGTSFSEVLEASGAPRGSLYHHFPQGKEQLVHAALEAAGTRSLAQLADFDGLAAGEVAARFFGMWRSLLTATDFGVGCAVAAVTVDAESDALLERAGEVFRAWRGRLAELLAEGGVGPDRSPGLAAMLLGASEGAVVLARAERDLAVFDAVAAEAIAAVGAAAAAA
ncbi:transcriptional regulator, TetR family [Agromyces sp. CF514]|uniref:TetR/AcrR family transcriptional regulator n=1 Tax=Agromyces sp. CF514 TaxID=1881031 RepID=UPI0008EB246A|nr:TetR/AcrR family transcriptional regulator [Agromyces sp. CF514]SFR71134.1 transcriptional regulator, TetR family [Agromyces sp. CF514]